MATFGMTEGCPSCMASFGEEFTQDDPPQWVPGRAPPCDKCCDRTSPPPRREDYPYPTHRDVAIKAKFMNENPEQVELKDEIDVMDTDLIGDLSGGISQNTWVTTGIGALSLGLSLGLPKGHEIVPLTRAVGVVFLALGVLGFGRDLG